MSMLSVCAVWWKLMVQKLERTPRSARSISFARTITDKMLARTDCFSVNPVFVDAVDQLRYRTFGPDSSVIERTGSTRTRPVLEFTATLIIAPRGRGVTPVLSQHLSQVPQGTSITIRAHGERETVPKSE